MEEDMEYKMKTILAVLAFKKDYPYKYGMERRFDGLNELIQRLNNIYSKDTRLAWENNGDEHSYESVYIPLYDLIIMKGKLSIITFLHEYAHALGMDEKNAKGWSVSLFETCYPKAMKNLKHSKSLLIGGK
jgi:hypothetical protein